MAEAKETKAKAKAYEDMTPEEKEVYLNEKVTIKIFKDGDKYKDDVVVNDNGRRFLIQRGVEVEVPRFVAWDIRDSEDADAITNATIEQMQSEYAAKAKSIG